MFGLGLIKGAAIGLTGGIIIGLVLKDACKKLKDKKNQNSYKSTSDRYNENLNKDIN